MKKIENISSTTKLSKDYLLAFGSIAHYLKRISEFHESRKTGEPLPTRWLHLAERSLLHRPVLKYTEYFNPAEYEAFEFDASVDARIKKLDGVVETMNSLLGEANIVSALRTENSPQLARLNELYEAVRQIVYHA